MKNSKFLNVLFVNHSLENFFGGTETWTMTMVKSFRELGHNAHFTSTNGLLHNSFKSNFKDLKEFYDLVIINGKSNIPLFRDRGRVSFFISHGILPSQEHPDNGTDIILSVSEEVCESITSKGFKCNGIIRNPIDLNKYKSNRKVNEIKTIGFFDRRRKFPFINEIKKFYNVIEIGNPPIQNVKDILDKCDLVVATGRAAYEAMALSKNVIVSGNNSGRNGNVEWMDGLVDDITFYEYRKNNFSGRRNKIEIKNADIFLDEVNKASVDQSERNRLLIKNNNSSHLIAEQLLNFYENINK